MWPRDVGAVDLLACCGGKSPKMKEYTPDTMDDVRLVLPGLHHNMKVEIEPGVPLSAKTVWDLRARGTPPLGLRLILPTEREHPESVLKVERRE